MTPHTKTQYFAALLQPMAVLYRPGILAVGDLNARCLCLSDRCLKEIFAQMINNINETNRTQNKTFNNQTAQQTITA